MEGVINFYFPFRLKDSPSLIKLDRRWKKMRTRQKREIKRGNCPFTDLIFKERYRKEAEQLLHQYQNTLGGLYCQCSIPHALPCLRDHYRSQHNNYIFSRNTSVLLSHSRIKYTESIESISRSKDVEAILLLNINTENRIGAYILAVRFKDYSVSECVYLQHVFYKNCVVTTVEADCIGKYPCAQHVANFKKSTSVTETIRDYISRHNVFSSRELSGQIDYRCRYTNMEVHTRGLTDKDIYGLVKGDERFDKIPENEDIKSLLANFGVTKKGYPQANRTIYINSHHVLMVVKETILQPFHYTIPDDGINTNEAISNRIFNIAGVHKTTQFSKYLREVEKHYLANSQNTNEMGSRQRSIIKPWKYIYRAKKLWEVIYEVDTYNDYDDSDYRNSFGTNAIVERLRQELQGIITIAIGQASAIIALASLIFTIFSLLRQV